MSKFTVRVEMAIYPKSDETVTLNEHYDTWAEADNAFLAYRTLAAMRQSRVHEVEMIEHREEVVHKTATKPDASSNVLPFGAAANGNG